MQEGTSGLGTSGLTTRIQNLFEPILQDWESFAGGDLFSEFPFQGAEIPFQIQLREEKSPFPPLTSQNEGGQGYRRMVSPGLLREKGKNVSYLNWNCCFSALCFAETPSSTGISVWTWWAS